MATYAVGDLQGCFDPLQRLLDGIAFDPANDQLWLVGDLVNRGPQSLEVLRFVRSLGPAAVTVLGNHDLHLIMQSQGYGKPNREDTLAPVLKAKDGVELIDWLRAQPLCVSARIGETDWAMVHAGLLPEWTIDQALALSAEVSAGLQAKNYRDFLANMWGSEPVRWSDGLLGWDRLRVVVNAMTRMRYLTADGAMEFRAPGAKSPPAQGPAGCHPWFDAPKRRHATHRIVCGHWSGLGLLERPDLMAIDTGCLWGGALTAVRLEDQRIFKLPTPAYAQPSGWD